MDSENSPEIPWWDQVPPVLWPIPVREAVETPQYKVDLVGSRVVVGDSYAEFWRYEQRAVSKIHQVRGEACVAVLPEVDWYRQKRDSTYQAVPHSVPISQVYLELALKRRPDEQPTPPDQSDISPDLRSASLVSQTTSPRVRWPQRASQHTSVAGARCWLATKEGIIGGYRALGEPWKKEVGTIDFSDGIDGLDKPVISTVISLFSEEDWYRWQDTGQTDDMLQIRAESRLTFLE